MEKDFFLHPVRVNEGAAPYLGGKRQLASRILPLINACTHETYAESFVGMGGIFFRRGYAPKQEVINDYGKEVATFFRALQRHYVAFMDMMKFQITTRHEFDRLKKTDPSLLTDLERAARFYYLQTLSFGGNPRHNSFGVQVGSPGRFDITRLGAHLEEIHTRLSGVVIENLSYEDFIPKYDRSGTLFYLDPPYWNGETDYGKNLFFKSDFQKLSSLLANLKGKFILSINDTPEIRKIFSKFHFLEVSLTYSIGKEGHTDAKELIYSNFEHQGSAAVQSLLLE